MSSDALNGRQKDVKSSNDRQNAVNSATDEISPEQIVNLMIKVVLSKGLAEYDDVKNAIVAVAPLLASVDEHRLIRNFATAKQKWAEMKATTPSTGVEGVKPIVIPSSTTSGQPPQAVILIGQQPQQPLTPVEPSSTVVKNSKTVVTKPKAVVKLSKKPS